MNDGLAIVHATALQAVANDLHVSLNRLRMTKPNTYRGTNDEQKRLLGYSTSMVVIRALAVELTLKALAFKRTGEYSRIHDLLKLYDSLGTDTQAIISKIEDIHGVASIRCILKKHKDDFVDWRYPINMRDGDNMHVDFLDIGKALDVLLLVYSHRDFIALCNH